METENFKRQVYEETERLFAKDDVDVVMRFSNPPSPVVHLTHKPTGISVICNRYPSHRENLAIARLQLRIATEAAKH